MVLSTILPGNPMQFDIHKVLELAGALVPLFSAIGSFFNHIVRQQTAEGKQPPAALLGANAVVNAVALNVDKAVQMGQMFKAVATAPKDDNK